MEMKRIGSLDVSVVGLGSNNFGTDFFGTACDQKMTDRIVHAALDAGINFIDTAEEYSRRTMIGTGRSEEFLRKALGSRRNDVIIATKFSPILQETRDRGRRRIMRAVEGSLRRLGTDRIDLYQQHFNDPSVPIDEFLEALDRLVREGKVREIGCSNFSGELIDAADAAARARCLARFVSAQNPYNLLDAPQRDDVLAACERRGLMLLPCFPLASGLLTGKYRRGEPVPADSRFGADTKVAGMLRPSQLSDARLATVDKLDGFARARGRSLLELAISWLASQPIVASVITGATRPEQIEANVAAAGWKLMEADVIEIQSIIARDFDPIL